MYKKIIRRYFSLFIIYIVGYSLLNLLFTGKNGFLKIEETYSNYWITFILIYISVFFVLRPIWRISKFNTTKFDGLLWVLIPFSIAVPTAFSQKYVKDINYKLIKVKDPSGVLGYPKEKFFHISKFRANHNFFILHKEKHVSGGRSKSLKVNNYFIGPMINENVSPLGKVAYGIKYSKSLNHGLLFRKNQPEKIEEFNNYSEKEFLKSNLYDVSFFEKQIDTKDAKEFEKAWKKNRTLNQDVEPVVLVGHKETIEKYFARSRNLMIFSVLISLSITLIILSLINYFRK